MLFILCAIVLGALTFTIPSSEVIEGPEFASLPVGPENMDLKLAESQPVLEGALSNMGLACLELFLDATTAMRPECMY